MSAENTGIRLGSVAATLRRRDTCECIADRAQWSYMTGVFHIPSIPTGEYTLTIDTYGPWSAYESYWSPASADLGIFTGQKATLALELEPCGRIEVLAKPGQSSKDLSWIDLLSKDGRSIDIRTDFRTRGGTPLLIQQVEEVWVYGGLTPGEYQVRVIDPQLGLIRREVQVQLGQTTRANCLGP